MQSVYVYPGSFKLNEQIQTKIDIYKQLFCERAFTVQYVMTKLQYLLEEGYIKKDDKMVFGIPGEQYLYYINDIFANEITKIDYSKTRGVFLMFAKQQIGETNNENV